MSNTTFTGRVTQDPELKFGQSGKAFLSLNVAENHRRKNQQTDQWEDSGTTWRRVTVFGPHAENAADRLRKGSLVLVTGRQETREYTKQDGTQGSSLEVLADEIGEVIPRWAPKQGQQQPQAAQGGGWGQSDPWVGQPSGNSGGGGTGNSDPGWGTPTDQPAF